jgi:hypothetical protein
VIRSREDALGLLRDIDSDFLEALAVKVGWGYPNLFEELRRLPADASGWAAEEFNRRRASVVNSALIDCAQKFGVPFEVMRLACNGQSKVLLKVGRVTLIQESIIGFDDHPSTADYKRALAETLAYTCQLELDLGDRPPRPDWAGSTLAVLLHGPAGKVFNKADTVLGNLMLALPDASYQQWVQRIDLHTVAMFGREAGVSLPAASPVDGYQADQVIITPKRKNVFKEAG